MTEPRRVQLEHLSQQGPWWIAVIIGWINKNMEMIGDKEDEYSLGYRDAMEGIADQLIEVLSEPEPPHVQ
jgi:hypothetical protein